MCGGNCRRFQRERRAHELVAHPGGAAREEGEMSALHVLVVLGFAALCVLMGIVMRMGGGDE
jgi:hypothetical protein